MATTAAGTPYVESSDLVANYPGTSLALANHIDDISAILQVVRATDTTERQTTSASYVDVTNMSVTITPQRNTSTILVITSHLFVGGGGPLATYRITDSSNNPISGAEAMNAGGVAGQWLPVVLIGRASPATTSAVTYKLRHLLAAGTVIACKNELSTGQVYAIEVAA